MIGLLNALPIGQLGSETHLKEVSKDQAVELLGNKFVSFIGHESTANILSNKLEIEVPMNRGQFMFLPENEAIVASFVMPRRLNEGEVLNENELLDMPIRYFHVTNS